MVFARTNRNGVGYLTDTRLRLDFKASSRTRVSEIGRLCIHLLGRRFHFNTVRRRRSTAWEIPKGARADQAEVDDPLLDEGHGR